MDYLKLWILVLILNNYNTKIQQVKIKILHFKYIYMYMTSVNQFSLGSLYLLKIRTGPGAIPTFIDFTLFNLLR